MKDDTDACDVFPKETLDSASLWETSSQFSSVSGTGMMCVSDGEIFSYGNI